MDSFTKTTDTGHTVVNIIGIIVLAAFAAALMLG